MYEGTLVDAHCHIFPDAEQQSWFVLAHPHKALVPDRETQKKFAADNPNIEIVLCPEDSLLETAYEYMVQANISRVNSLLLYMSGYDYFQRTKDLFDFSKRLNRGMLNYDVPSIEAAEERRRDIVKNIAAFNEWGVTEAGQDARFGCFIGLNPVLMTQFEMMTEVEDKVRRGATGIKLAALDYEAYFTDPRHFALYDFCQDKSIPILFAPGRSTIFRPTPPPGVWGHPNELYEVLSRFPRLKVCLAHMRHPSETALLTARFPGVYTDLSVALLLAARGSDDDRSRLVHDIRSVGTDRVLFGTNFGTRPVSMALEQVRMFRELALADSDFHRVGSLNYWEMIGT